MPLVLQLHLIMMSKYSEFGVDIFNMFFHLWATLKILQDYDNNNYDSDNNDNDLAITIAQFFLQNRQVKTYL